MFNKEENKEEQSKNSENAVSKFGSSNNGKEEGSSL